ncbi:hypothetical protein OG693_39880 [Streptomyces sp. NBC_01259]|uniref:hypothetical protein n=1 Tax=Streptomyces sp. NBC_01259 TaxID=2903800 RepID=UPI00324D0503
MTTTRHLRAVPAQQCTVPQRLTDVPNLCTCGDMVCSICNRGHFRGRHPGVCDACGISRADADFLEYPPF